MLGAGRPFGSREGGRKRSKQQVQKRKDACYIKCNERKNQVRSYNRAWLGRGGGVLMLVMVKELMFGPEDRPGKGRGEKHSGQREQHVVSPKAGVSLACWSTGQTRLILE